MNADVGVGRNPQRHGRRPAGQPRKRHLNHLRILLDRSIVSLLIQKSQADGPRPRSMEPISKHAAATPLDGEVMIGVGAGIEHGNDGRPGLCGSDPRVVRRILQRTVCLQA